MATQPKIVEMSSGRRTSRIEKVYDYRDDRGKHLYQIVRYNPKGFGQRYRKSASSNWIWKKYSPQVLYNLPAVLKAPKVYIVEGEKDADTLNATGRIATTNAGGATAPWLSQFTEALKDKEVVIIPDNDQPGTERALRIAHELIGSAATITISFPANNARDVTAWFESHPSETKFRLGARHQITTHADMKRLEDGLRASGKLPQSNSNSNDATRGRLWPAPLGKDALVGILGDFVRLVEPHSEADPAALAIQFLVGFGNVIGRSAHFVIEETRHYTNLYAIVVGTTSRARKGTSWDRVKARLCGADPVWARDRIKSGLVSGEGLIEQFKKRNQRNDRAEESQADLDEEAEADDLDDKRLMISESEFARVLRSCSRDGSTLSPVIREGWDSGSLHNLTKKSPTEVHDAHLSFVGHITSEELERRLSETEVANGLANRFLWACAKRSKLLPHGGSIDQSQAEALDGRILKAVKFGWSTGNMVRSKDADSLWNAEYERLTTDYPGLVGCATSRSEAQVLRLSMIFAILDLSKTIKPQHLRAALEIWRYCLDSARYIFGDSLGDVVADSLLKALRQKKPMGLTRDEIRNSIFKRNRSASDIERALRLLEKHGLARKKPAAKATGAGRPEERWEAV